MAEALCEPLAVAGADLETQKPVADVATLTARQRERRDRIVAAAIDHMLTTDYERIQIRDVAASAEVALGTLYRYFATKDHLFAEALESWANRYPAQEAPVGGRSVDNLKRAFSLAVRGFERNPTVYGTMLVLQVSTDPRAAGLFQQFAAERRAAFELHLPRIEPERRRRIIVVMSSVLDVSLRMWVTGQQSLAEVHEALDSAAELLCDR